MKAHFRKAAKAYVAAAIAAGSFLAPVVDDGLAASEAIGVLVAGLTAWQAVYWTPTPDAVRQVSRITGAFVRR